MLRQVKVVLFDAVGTVLCPQPGVADVYHDIGRQCGSGRSREEIQARFQAAFARQEKLDCGVWPGYSVTGLASRHDPSTLGRTDEAREAARWREIVADVFDDLADTADLFESLWEHFAEPGHWAVFPDVAPVWARLHEGGLKLGLASNFDARLAAICRRHPPLRLCDRLFYSSQLGWRKPFEEFFAAIQRALDVSPSEILMVGDSLENDYLPAVSVGWRAVLLRRDGELPSGVRCVRGLAALLSLP